MWDSCTSLAIRLLVMLIRVRSTLCNHGIPLDEVKAAFELSREFFALPDQVKGKTALDGKNAGWEKNTQVRPSTGTADQKVRYQYPCSSIMHHADL